MCPPGSACIKLIQMKHRRKRCPRIHSEGESSEQSGGTFRWKTWDALGVRQEKNMLAISGEGRKGKIKTALRNGVGFGGLRTADPFQKAILRGGILEEMRRGIKAALGCSKEGGTGGGPISVFSPPKRGGGGVSSAFSTSLPPPAWMRWTRGNAHPQVPAINDTDLI